MIVTRIIVEFFSFSSFNILQIYGLYKLLPIKFIHYDIKSQFIAVLISLLYVRLIDYNLLPDFRWYDISDYYVVPFIFTVVLLFAIMTPERLLLAYHPSSRSDSHKKNLTQPLAHVMMFSYQNFFINSVLFFTRSLCPSFLRKVSFKEEIMET